MFRRVWKPWSITSSCTQRATMCPQDPLTQPWRHQRWAAPYGDGAWFIVRVSWFIGSVRYLLFHVDNSIFFFRYDMCNNKLVWYCIILVWCTLVLLCIWICKISKKFLMNIPWIEVSEYPSRWFETSHLINLVYSVLRDDFERYMYVCQIIWKKIQEKNLCMMLL